MTFENLGIINPILKGLAEEGYTNPTPIQEQSIPILLRKKDLLACAQTGTGKTAAFAIPILQHLKIERNNSQNKGRRKVKALIVAPTRELAIQIADSFSAYGKFTGIRNTVIFGGVRQGPQTRALDRGVDILVATPGRLLDLIDQGFITLKDIEYFVLDEADRMLAMGFIHSIKKIIAQLPVERHSLFFSATMLPDIVKLSQKILGNPEKVTIKPDQTTAERVEQGIFLVRKSDKAKLLLHLLNTEEFASVLVFSRTKHGANKIVRILGKSGVQSEAIHGNKSQTARQRALKNFKDGRTKVLVATDIAARGIDVDGLSHVINYDLPNVPETYVHRIGRTGRASASGVAYSFCDVEERAYLRSIQKLIKQDIPVIDEHPYVDDSKEVKAPKKPKKPKRPKPKQKTYTNEIGGGNNGNTRNSENKGDTAKKPKKSSGYWKKRRANSRNKPRPRTDSQ